MDRLQAGSPILVLVLIAQISDCHIRDSVGMFGGLVDTSETLARVVDHLNGLNPAPDVVLATGDLTDDGTEIQYSMFLDLVAGLEIPLLPLPGNHDVWDAFRSAFADRLPATIAEGHCSYVVDSHPVRLVGLDTLIPGRHDGRFHEGHEEWLDAVLQVQPDRPTLVFTHFPPFKSGLTFMDLSGLDGADRLRSVLERHPQVKLLVAGHIHRPIQTTIGSTLVSVCPSTGNQLGLELDPMSGSAVDEPPAYQLHCWDGDRFVTHTATMWEGRRMDLSDFIVDVHRRAAAGEGSPRS
ncbi:MAG: 3',5'-cyclic adenosine monophosphate phosphodiesterase CpdA [Acidimicrobiaceae bacterium]|nr:3',5'-cyclic adenosine monophosphate phosphodiesterase CpdA [Acidimicrobiaceae bacterium]